MIYCCNMIIFILLTFISSVQMVDYDDGNPWWDHLLDNQPDADPNRRILWTHLGDSQHHCNEPKASSCSYIRINMNILVHQNWFYLPEEPFSKMKFKRRVTHKLNGQYFAEFEYRQKNLKRTNVPEFSIIPFLQFWSSQLISQSLAIFFILLFCVLILLWVNKWRLD